MKKNSKRFSCAICLGWFDSLKKFFIKNANTKLLILLRSYRFVNDQLLQFQLEHHLQTMDINVNVCKKCYAQAKSFERDYSFFATNKEFLLELSSLLDVYNMPYLIALLAQMRKGIKLGASQMQKYERIRENFAERAALVSQIDSLLNKPYVSKYD